jgi:catechol 2,3-dioxygenase-like lactoylglutathione lyase family enzyme
MNITKIKETCIYAHDLNAIYEFYHHTLELPVISYLENKHLFFRAGTSVLLFFNPEDSVLKKSPPSHYGGGKQHFAFEVPEREYEEAKQFLRSKGIMITEEATWKSGKKSAYFNDPAGNVLEIVPDRGIWD